MKRLKRFMKILVEAFFKSLAIMALIACIVCIVFALISLLMALRGEMTWKAPAIFAIIGVCLGTACFTISDILM